MIPNILFLVTINVLQLYRWRLGCYIYGKASCSIIIKRSLATYIVLHCSKFKSHSESMRACACVCVYVTPSIHRSTDQLVAVTMVRVLIEASLYTFCVCLRGCIMNVGIAIVSLDQVCGASAPPPKINNLPGLGSDCGASGL